MVEKSAATSIEGSAPRAMGTDPGMSTPRRHRSREDYERGLPDYHDPTAGFAGAPPAQSALTLRAVLAVFGLLVCVAGGGGFPLGGVSGLAPRRPFFLPWGAPPLPVVLRPPARQGGARLPP